MRLCLLITTLFTCCFLYTIQERTEVYREPEPIIRTKPAQQPEIPPKVARDEKPPTGKESQRPEDQKPPPISEEKSTDIEKKPQDPETKKPSVDETKKPTVEEKPIVEGRGGPEIKRPENILDMPGIIDCIENEAFTSMPTASSALIDEQKAYAKVLAELMVYERVKFKIKNQQSDYTPAAWNAIRDQAVNRSASNPLFDARYQQLIFNERRVRTDLQRKRGGKINPESYITKGCKNLIFDTVNKEVAQEGKSALPNLIDLK